MYFLGIILVVGSLLTLFLVVERLGKYHKMAQSGFNFLWPFLDQVRPIFLNGRGFLSIDIREQVIDFPPQPVITRDNVTMAVDTVLYYQITDPIKAVYEIADLGNAIQQLTTTTLRNVMGELALDETLTSRETVNVKLRDVLDEATDKWGVKVNRVELKNIEPPLEIQDAMAKQMKAEREKRALILESEGLRASEILKAEGAKQSQILEAEGRREAAFRDAEAREREAEAEAKAKEEAEEAAQRVLGGESSIKLTPQRSYVRRLQHILGQRYNLSSISHGRDPERCVMFYKA